MTSERKSILDVFRVDEFPSVCHYFNPEDQSVDMLVVLRLQNLRVKPWRLAFGAHLPQTALRPEFILCFVKEHIYHQHSGLVTLALSFSPFEAFSLSGEPLIQTKLKHV